jgi:aldose sugar dehydrogenase
MGIPVLMTRPFFAALSLIALASSSCSAATVNETGTTETGVVTSPTDQVTQVKIEDMATFNEPWAMAFLPGSEGALITEKAGKLKFWQPGKAPQDVAGVPKVDFGDQGGFGDVVPAPDYATSKMVYLSWVVPGPKDTRGAVIGRAKLEFTATGPALQGLTVIWNQAPRVSGRGHFSHRIAFSPDGQYLFVSSGERQKFTPAQDLTNNLGKVLRLMPDGTPAPDNPLAGKVGQSPEIWSYGHRNVLGLKFDASGQLWDLEHGPDGGDELNLVRRAANYGWPLVSNGDHYDGKPIPRHATRPDLAAPAISWNPVIAPGDFIFYSGQLFTGWNGQAIIAGLGTQGLVRVAIDGDKAREIERIALGARIREVKQGADGALWILEDGEGGRLRKLTPAQ